MYICMHVRSDLKGPLKSSICYLFDDFYMHPYFCSKTEFLWNIDNAQLIIADLGSWVKPVYFMAFSHTHIHPSIHKYVYTYTYIHTIHAYIHTYIHAYIYIYTYITARSRANGLFKNKRNIAVVYHHWKHSIRVLPVSLSTSKV